MGALDTAGEWINEGNTLYLYPPAADNPSTHVVEARHRVKTLNLDGLSQIQVRDMIMFAGSVTLNGSSYCGLENCHIAYAGHNTMMWDARQGWIDVNAQDNLKTGVSTAIYFGGANCFLKKSSVRFSAGPGVSMAGLNDTISNCLIDQSGYQGMYASGLFFTFDPSGTASSTRGGAYVYGNTISNSGRYLIAFVGNERSHWSPTYWNKCLILNNNLYNCNILTHDGAAVGDFAGCRVDNTELAYNAVHDNFDPEVYGGLLYYDSQQGGAPYLNVHHNIIWCEPGLKSTPQVCLSCQVTYQNNAELGNRSGGLSGIPASSYPGGVKFPVGHDWGVPPEYNPSGTSTAVVRNISRVQTAAVPIAGDRLSLPAGAGKARVEVLRGDGRRIMEAMTVDCSDKNIVVPFDHLPAGMCVVRILWQGGEIVRRLPVVR
jgi:hypothetical protein